MKASGLNLVNRKKLDPDKNIRSLLGAKLRKYRDAEGLTQAQLAAVLGYVPELISKIETGELAPVMKLAEALNHRYGTEAFTELQPHAGREQAQAAVPEFFRSYISREADASALRIYEQRHIPGLLQTPEYATEVLRAGQRKSDLERKVDGRLDRQAVISGEDPAWLVVLLDEDAVRRVVGSPEITRAQLLKLLDWAAEPHISVLVVPAGAPVYPASGFTLISSEGAQDVAYTEGAGGGGEVIELSSRVAEIRRLWDMLSQVTLSPAASEKLIRDVAEGFEAS
ncbi:helix-turn-helix domain-containing protein [Actinomadura harenae]|uniref:XRE family transcriptional regulator n=1 Tax=Actinomadura harenae TaxID=2483351 RepID=A0A3M2LJ46_9ACTN|nr:helix-turn-helix transcriptional regulator [Actinomadura harenae]RMI37499.1 XRE family transcriptional regulator [Actinomadura harenae]